MNSIYYLINSHIIFNQEKNIFKRMKMYKFNNPLTFRSKWQLLKKQREEKRKHKNDNVVAVPENLRWNQDRTFRWKPRQYKGCVCFARSRTHNHNKAAVRRERKRRSAYRTRTEALSWLGGSGKCCCVMSGGIARGRLTEERKSWRKNHPHVRTTLLLLDSSFISKRCRFGV